MVAQKTQGPKAKGHHQNSISIFIFNRQHKFHQYPLLPSPDSTVVDMSDEDVYMAVKMHAADLDGVSYQDFGFITEDEMKQIYDQLPLSKKPTIRRLWTCHPAKTPAGNEFFQALSNNYFSLFQ